MSLSKKEQKLVMEALRGAGTCSGVEPKAHKIPEVLRDYHPKLGDGIAFFYKESDDRKNYIGKMLLSSSWGAREELERLDLKAIRQNPPTVHAKFSTPLEVGDYYASEVTVVRDKKESGGELIWFGTQSRREEIRTLWKWIT